MTEALSPGPSPSRGGGEAAPTAPALEAAERPAGRRGAIRTGTSRERSVRVVPPAQTRSAGSAFLPDNRPATVGGRRSAVGGRVAAGLSGLGVLLAGYLTWLKLAGAEALCAGVGGCNLVQNSSYAELFGVPIAALGLGVYAAIFALSLVWLGGGRFASEAGLGVFGLALAGVAYSVYLTWLELFVLEAICPWCVTSAVLLVGILGASGWAIVRAPGGGGD